VGVGDRRWQLFQGKTDYDHDFVGFHERFLVTSKGKCNDQRAGTALSPTYTIDILTLPPLQALRLRT
jgi:hypothetical protein